MQEGGGLIQRLHVAAFVGKLDVAAMACKIRRDAMGCAALRMKLSPPGVIFGNISSILRALNIEHTLDESFTLYTYAFRAWIR